MATSIEIINPNIVEIPPSGDTNCRDVTYDAKVIVSEIIQDIFDRAIQISEEAQQIELDGKSTTDTGDSIIDLTRNYKEEFKNILQNLKCQAYKEQLTENTSLEDQIKKVIEEIKALETSLRNNIEKGRGDINLSEELKNRVCSKTEITNFLDPNEQKIILNDDLNDEVVLQVINLQGDSEASSFNAFPSEEELEDVSLTIEYNLNQGDQQQQIALNPQISNLQLNAGETAFPNPVPDPEPEEKLQKPEEGTIRKKKSIGRRLWHFMKKSSKNESSQVDQKSIASKALGFEFI